MFTRVVFPNPFMPAIREMPALKLKASAGSRFDPGKSWYSRTTSFSKTGKFSMEKFCLERPYAKYDPTIQRDLQSPMSVVADAFIQVVGGRQEE